MPTIKDMLASLKRAHTFKTDGWTCPAHPDANGGACLCGIDAFNARIDAVAAQVEAEIAELKRERDHYSDGVGDVRRILGLVDGEGFREGVERVITDRDALIGKMAGGLSDLVEAIACNDVDVKRQGFRAEFDAARDLLAPDAITRAIEERRAVEAVIAAAMERADLHREMPRTMGKPCDCGLCLAVADYRAQRGSK